MSDQKPMLEDKSVSEKSRKHFKYRSTTCLNCSHPLDLSDRYCPYCSQLNSTKSLSFKDFFGEFFNSIISYDSRLRYTVRDLLFKPGTITYNFINGQRLRYANPFRFFLSVSIIFFLLNGLTSALTGDDNINFNNGEVKDDGVVQWSTGDGVDSINIKNEIEKAKALQLAAETKNPDKTSIDSTIIDSTVAAKKSADDAIWEEMKKGYLKGYNAGKEQFAKDTIPEADLKKAVANENVIETEVENDIALEASEKIDSTLVKKSEQDTTTTKATTYITQAAIDTTGFVESISDRLNAYYLFYEDTEIKDPYHALDSLGHESSRINIWLYEKNFALERFKEKPSDFVSYILNKVPFFLFFFTPFFAFFFWLIYSKKKYTYMEHNVFIFHIFSFLFLGAIISLLPDMIIGNQIVLSILLALIAPFYFYKALRNFYKEGRLITIIKLVFLNFVFFISSTFAAALFFLITAAMY